ncbi:MAG: FliG C-terminal domain-containing protein [Candidatus Margulisbacteria bacterium]|nr:FliG C-terminal domain-containing protein [Candidatus Margulisiibacteriota bacterium]
MTEIMQETKSNPNLEKAAVLLLAIENMAPGITIKIINTLGEEKAKPLLEQIAKTGRINNEKRVEVINDFYSIALDKQYVFGGLDVSSKLLKESFGINKANEFFKNKKDKFRFLEDVPLSELKEFLLKETDQMKIFVFNYLSPRKAAELLEGMDDESFALKIMNNLELPNAVLLYDFEVELAAHFNALREQSTLGAGEYLQKLAAIMEFLPENKREQILSKYTGVNEEFANKLRTLIFTFEDFNDISDQVFQTILFEISDFRLIAYSRLNTTAVLAEKINRCLTERTRTIVDSESIGLEKKISAEQIEDAKRKIVGIARKLEQKGGIKLTHEPEK